MKTKKETVPIYTPQELAEAHIFPAELSADERGELLSAFKAHRNKTKEAETEKSRLISRLLQLKYLMQDYLATEDPQTFYQFGFFLKEYMNRVNKKSNELAKEISVPASEVSLVANNRRKPTEKFILRLDIHSNHNFPARLWFRILEKEREHELFSDRKILEQEKKQVRKKLSVTI
jgi:plasmid maintenance system antidote protein VapI